nr:MAG TPA: hypothetical protein [Caudoviricetes sp.]
MLKRRITSVLSSKLSSSADKVLMNAPSSLALYSLNAAIWPLCVCVGVPKMSLVSINAIVSAFDFLIGFVLSLCCERLNYIP